VIDPLKSLVEKLEQDPSLHEPHNLHQRVEALERLEAYLLDAHAHSNSIYQRAAAISTKLETVNFELFDNIRREIQRGGGPEAMRPWLNAIDLPHGEGYDYLDELIIGILQLEEPGVSGVPPDEEMVFYQPTSARHIFDLIRRVALTERDVLTDLGSGLGHVSLLASICTKARCVGIELEPAYIHCARQSAEGLNVNNVTFVQEDARTADLSAGTVFYLYTPFSGSILRAVLDALRHEASKRPIRVCTYGPCTPTVAEEPWLETDGPPAIDRIAVFRSRLE
jgi:hypothetical protein